MQGIEPMRVTTLPPRWRLALYAVVLLAIVVSGTALLLADVGGLKTMRHAVFDQYQRWHPRPYADTAVRVIDVDEETLARLGQWPWPRTRIAQLLRSLQSAGPAAVGFDVVFAEPDRTSPEQMADIWELPATQRAALLALPSHDALLAQAIAGSPVVMGFSVVAQAPKSGAGQALSIPARYVQMGPSPLALHRFDGAVPALPALTAAAAGNGALVFLPDNDGVVRRVPLVLRVKDALVPSLAAEMLRVGQAQPNYVLRTAPEGGALQELRVGQIVVPTTAEGEAWVHYSREAPRRTIPAWTVMEGKVPASELAGKLILIGSSAHGLMDLRFSPLGTVIPGVEVHAQLLEQALTDGFLYRPHWATAAEVLVLVFGCLLVGVAAFAFTPGIAATLAFAVMALLLGGGWRAFTAHQLLLDAMTPVLAVAVAFVVPSLLRYHHTEQRRRWVSGAFSRYVSPNLVAHILQHPEQLELGGRRQVCSFVFTDLAGFTRLMEKIEPAKAVELLNAYLDRMVAIAFEHQGTLDRIVGDAVAVMFSAPVQQADHQQRAFDCAVAMQRFATNFAQAQQRAGVPFGRTRIGVHSGEVTVGNFGGSVMFDYRALGDAVNTASRLESINKKLGIHLSVSQDTLQACRSAPVRTVGNLVLSGKSEPLRVFHPWNDALEGEPDLQAIADYESAYALLAQQPDDALAAFEALATRYPDDSLMRLHRDRLRRGERGDVLHFADK